MTNPAIHHRPSPADDSGVACVSGTGAFVLRTRDEFVLRPARVHKAVQARLTKCAGDLDELIESLELATDARLTALLDAGIDDAIPYEDVRLSLIS